MVKVCVNYLKPGDNPHMFRTVVQFSSWVKAVSTSMESITFEESEGNKLESEEVKFEQEKLCMGYMSCRQNFNSNPEWKSVPHVSMVE